MTSLTLDSFIFILVLYLLSPQNTSSLSGLTYICYIIAALTQLFLYCFGGNHVGESVSKTPDHFPHFPRFSTFMALAQPIFISIVHSV